MMIKALIRFRYIFVVRCSLRNVGLGFVVAEFELTEVVNRICNHFVCSADRNYFITFISKVHQRKDYSFDPLYSRSFITRRSQYNNYKFSDNSNMIRLARVCRNVGSKGMRSAHKPDQRTNFEKGNNMWQKTLVGDLGMTNPADPASYDPTQTMTDPANYDNRNIVRYDVSFTEVFKMY